MSSSKLNAVCYCQCSFHISNIQFRCEAFECEAFIFKNRYKIELNITLNQQNTAYKSENVCAHTYTHLSVFSTVLFISLWPFDDWNTSAGVIWLMLFGKDFSCNVKSEFNTCFSWMSNQRKQCKWGANIAPQKLSFVSIYDKFSTPKSWKEVAKNNHSARLYNLTKKTVFNFILGFQMHQNIFLFFSRFLWVYRGGTDK